MTPSQLKRARELSAGVAAFSKGSKRQKGAVLSPYRMKRPLTLSERVASLGAAKPAPAVEKLVYTGPPGLRGLTGKDGKSGRDGKHGVSPIKGQDYFTKEEVNSIKSEIVTEIRTLIPEAQKVEKVEPLTVDQEFVKKIIAIMHSLPETDKLEVSKGIRNASSFIYKGTKYETSELMHGGSSSSSTGGFTTISPISGVVNSSNTVFGFSQAPSFILSDGILLPSVGNNGDVFWTIAGTTVTMVNPPAYSLLGVV